MKKPNKVGTTIYLNPAQRKALAKLSAQRDVSMGILIREAVALLLARHKGAK